MKKLSEKWIVIKDLPFARAGETLIYEDGEWRKERKDGYDMSKFQDFLTTITKINSFGNCGFHEDFIYPMFDNFSFEDVMNEAINQFYYGDFCKLENQALLKEPRKTNFKYSVYRALKNRRRDHEKTI